MRHQAPDPLDLAAASPPDRRVIANQNDFVSINATLSVDSLGQWQALIAIAPPDHRAALTDEAQRMSHIS